MTQRQTPRSSSTWSALCCSALGSSAFVDTAWIVGALTLFALALALVLGALGGRRPRQARLLTGGLARDDDSVKHELRRLLEDHASAAANYAAVVASPRFSWFGSRASGRPSS